jgi:hypothetical protein
LEPAESLLYISILLSKNQGFTRLSIIKKQKKIYLQLYFGRLRHLQELYYVILNLVNPWFLFP